MVADELTPAYHCDLIVRPGLTSIVEISKAGKLLSGPRYIPIRRSLMDVSSPEVEGIPLRLLVVGGGADDLNFVPAIKAVLLELETPFQATLFTKTGSLEASDPRFKTVANGLAFDAYIATTDLAFTTASTTSLELISRGIAIGIGCSVDNQAYNYRILSTLGLAGPVGVYSDGQWKLDRDIIRKLVVDKEYRSLLRKRAVGHIDSSGAQRIVEEIQQL